MTKPAWATFFISTGRCGTQWLSKTLQDAFASQAVVTHEPIRAAYKPRCYLRSETLEDMLCDPVVSEHIAGIEATLDGGTAYVEVGWPCYPALPLLARRFRDRIRFVHLVRHPVPTAISLATHRLYERDDWITDGAISPMDPGVVHKELAPAWEALTIYEKCLFWWTEINLYGLELERMQPEVPYLRIRYEDLFASGEPTALQQIVSHCGLAFFPELSAARAQRVDAWQHPGPSVNQRVILKYRHIVELAEQLGYRIGTDDVGASPSAS